MCVHWQLKLLRLLALLGQGDKAASENMFQIVGDTLRRASTSHTIGNAIICETVRTITTIYPNQILLRSGASPASNWMSNAGCQAGCMRAERGQALLRSAWGMAGQLSALSTVRVPRAFLLLTVAQCWACEVNQRLSWGQLSAAM